MSWIDSIEEFVPSNEQERKDKEVILKYINIFDDILKRDNEIIHITSSGFVINKDKDKALMVHHNIFNAWSLPGGHADGEENLLGVAISEIEEETGVKDIIPITNKIISLDILSLLGHFRKGKYVSSHLHISVVYLVQADENEQIIIKPDENSAVKWIPISEMDIYSSESHMKKIYNKIISRIEKLPV
ncbi:NUDIX hydrolase [Clostridium sp. CS001]|uniref:NUDIX hydrolase n=1 Tax=Clostridium sp. CS001 TaxID=2880648 RepID=UPI001CF46596|nr:NUDIX hydrolase [Clostridium sp. CS001]MCB2290873.1 NUDIX hydrolase [Clostridium sp. CS001]